ncbi:MAG: hypothetical protein AAGJ40_06995 [Planctomycetota bacterium]
MRFTIRSVLILVAVVAVWYANHPVHEYHPRQIQTRSKASGDGRSIVQVTTGIRRHKNDRELDRLDFCVIHRVDGQSPVLDSVVQWSTGSSQYHSEAMLLNDGRRIRLPNDTQLHEVVNGQYRSSHRRLTLSQFRSALGTISGPPSMAALLNAADHLDGSAKAATGQD